MVLALILPFLPIKGKERKEREEIAALRLLRQAQELAQGPPAMTAMM